MFNHDFQIHFWYISGYIRKILLPLGSILSKRTEGAWSSGSCYQKRHSQHGTHLKREIDTLIWCIISHWLLRVQLEGEKNEVWKKGLFKQEINSIFHLLRDDIITQLFPQIKGLRNSNKTCGPDLVKGFPLVKGSDFSVHN